MKEGIAELSAKIRVLRSNACSVALECESVKIADVDSTRRPHEGTVVSGCHQMEVPDV